MATFQVLSPEAFKKLQPAQQQLYVVELTTHLSRAEEEKAAIIKRSQGSFRIKTGEKGGVSVYGFGRFPITLYKEQWLRFMVFIGLIPEDMKVTDITDEMNPVLVYIRDHDSELKTKVQADVDAASKPAEGLN